MKTFNQDKKLTKEEIDMINQQKVFGKSLDELENYSIKDLYNFIKEHSIYLDNIPIEEVKDIAFTELLDICILTKDEKLYVNGHVNYTDIVEMGNLYHVGFYLIHNNNTISFKILYGCDNVRDFIDKDEQFKKILITPVRIVVLTNENDLKIVGFYDYAFIDKDQLIDIQNIGYLPYNDEIVILKKGKPKFLFKILDYQMFEDEIEWVDNYKKIYPTNKGI